MEQFYNTWHKNSYYWFNQNNDFDEYISNKFGYLIDNYIHDNYKPIYGILIYDQLTRHYYRKEVSNHIITYFNRKALEIAIKHIRDLDNLSYNDWLFFILVFRHTNEKEHLLFAMDQAWKRGSKSFLKATYNRANFKEHLEFYDCSRDYYSYYDFNRDILDNNPEDYIKDDMNYNIGNYKELPDTNRIIVSLSGGVDSISCLYSMVNLYGNEKIVAVHINYYNRIETMEETRFLIYFCNKLKVRLYIRTITEIQRQKSIDNDMREVYENYTKKVRFNSYRRVYELEGGKNIPLVILGHNRDDCLENILTNIAYKNKYDNLNGIELSMIIDNINFYRPIIEVSKSEIYKFAITHNLPYLKNSTPNWCQRGKIRTTVVPVLEKWDNRIIAGLFNITEILKDLHINLYSTIKEIQYNNSCNISSLNTSILYWKYGIYHLYNFYPTNKSLNCLIQRLKLFKETYNSREINKKTKIIINKKLYLSLWKSKDINQVSYEFICYNKNM